MRIRRPEEGLALEGAPPARQVVFEPWDGADHALGFRFVVHEMVIIQGRTPLEKLFRERDKIPVIVQ